MAEHVEIPPASYERWRRSRLGSITEAREREVLVDLVGPVEGRRILDVGCGDGVFAVGTAGHGARVVGVDVSTAMLVIARRRAAKRGVSVDLVRADAAALPFTAGAFDVVVATTVLCLVPDPEAVVAEMVRVLAPGGRLVVGELGRWSSWAAWRRLRGWLGSPTWSRAAFRSAGELRDLLERAELRVDRVEGAVYYPPVPWLARVLAPRDRVVGKLTTVGAAFVAVAATQPPSPGGSAGGSRLVSDER